MSNQIKIIINNKKYLAQPGETILDIAQKNNLFIPTLCKHPDLKIQGRCRVCLVELGNGQLVTACSTPAEDGMKVKLDTLAVKRARQINMEMIFAEHMEKCGDCIQEHNCLLKKYAEKYGARLARFQDRKRKAPVWNFGALNTKPLKHLNIKTHTDQISAELRRQEMQIKANGFVQFDASKCVDCGICTEVCRDRQTVDFYETAGKGYLTQTKPTDDPTKDCVYCGQCIVHCPVGAIQGVAHWPAVEDLLKNKNSHKKILVAQIAPSVRVAIGEEFNLPYGQVMTGQLAASMRALGFDAAFDVTVGADFTTYEEARDLVHWLESGKDRPMITSCCPGWVKFVEFYYPEFVPHLTSTRSPHIISGILAKTYWADLLHKKSEDIIVVSIMPCTAKKQEISLERHYIQDTRYKIQDTNKIQNPKSETCPRLRSGIQNKLKIKNSNLKIDSKFKIQNSKFALPAVDYVLTTREYAYLLKRNQIDLKKIKPETMDNPLGRSSGAGAIYGASGGVMESALRTADYFLRVKQETGSLESVLLGQNHQLGRYKFSAINQNRLEFHPVRGLDGIREAKVTVAGLTLKVAVVNELGNARAILDKLSQKKVKYDYIEVMACPGGCIGGGGQPVPTSSVIRAKRAAALYNIDQKAKIRSAHDNSALLKIYQDYFKGNEEMIEELLHCKYKAGGRAGYRQIK